MMVEERHDLPDPTITTGDPDWVNWLMIGAFVAVMIVVIVGASLGWG